MVNSRIDTTDAIVVGGADYTSKDFFESEPPKHGVIVAMVQKGSNADDAGIRRGDVLLKYAEHEISTVRDLGAAIQLAKQNKDRITSTIDVEFWRDGVTRGVKLEKGQMGLSPYPSRPNIGMRTIRILDGAVDGTAFSMASTLEQIRLYGGELSPLQWSEIEALETAAVLGNARLLTNKEATVSHLRAEVDKQAPRILHLATHGLMGSMYRPQDASLAFTIPEQSTIQDNGFLTLKEIAGDWIGRLRGCQLVTLSACDTGRGVLQGDTVMGLPLGFMAAGAESVVASLWAVDDQATVLLMTRFYANLTGQFDGERRISAKTFKPKIPMSKLDALDEAKSWLRNLTSLERDQLIAGVRSRDTQSANRGDIVPLKKSVRNSNGDPASLPYSHPRFWAAFILLGKP